MEQETVVIVGGGPAGLFCAIECACEKRNVVLLEKNQLAGKKLLITGSGQCNLTHDGEISAFFFHYGDHGAFLRPALMQCTNRDLIRFFEEQGLMMESDPGGKVFPRTRQAADVLAVLLATCRLRGVDIRCNEAVCDVKVRNGIFLVMTSSAAITADRLVLATGGASYPATGSTGDGYRLARNLGLGVTGIAPALTGVYVEDFPFTDLAGISFTGLTVSLFRGNRKIRDQTGDLLFTHSGLSGPVVLDLSRFVIPGDVLKIAFIPGIDNGAARKELEGRIAGNGPRLVRTILASYLLPDRFIRKVLALSGLPADLTCAHLSRQGRTVLVSLLGGFPCTVRRLGGFSEAMVTRGGVSLEEIQPKTMESTKRPHLYIIGELLDIDGDTGGYNLQAAFSTGFLAARHIRSGM
ncbi:MAG: NAD(P)/FAD-dependent oxidoreductase [Methanoregulaceae archaeon]|nr:NAD(P)/FAD-dependent oxidoreductase [Methanoregulaceae archaeon]